MGAQIELTTQQMAWMVRSWNRGMPAQDIARRLGRKLGRRVSMDWVQAWVRRERNAGRKLKPADRERTRAARERRAVKMMRDETEWVEICRRTHVRMVELEEIAAREGLTRPARPRALAMPNGRPGREAWRPEAAGAPSFIVGGQPGVDDGPSRPAAATAPQVGREGEAHTDDEGGPSAPKSAGRRQVTLVSSVATGETYPHEVAT